MIDFIQSILNVIADFIIAIINFLLVGVGEILNLVARLFPDSPFLDPLQPPAIVNLAYVNWFLPFPQMLAHALLITSAIAVYYGIRVLARWIKLVRG